MAKAKSKKMPQLIFNEKEDGGVAYKAKGANVSQITLAPHFHLMLRWCLVMQVELNLSRTEAFKVVFLGDSDVGKTCLARLYMEGEVQLRTTNTIGFDHHIKEVLEPETSVTTKVYS